MLSLTQFVRRAAQINPNGTATICGERRRTWLEFEDRVQRTAGMLRDLGLQENQHVAILSTNSDLYLEYLFAIPWAGGVSVPINTRWATPEIIECLKDSGARYLIAADPFADLVETLHEQCDSLRKTIYIGDGACNAHCLSHNEHLASSKKIADVGRHGSDLAALFYTGGTTGRAKGVMITHEGMFLNILQWINAVGVTSDDRFLITPPMFHAAGGENSMAVVALAATAYFMPQFDIPVLLKAVQEEGLTKLPLVATMLDMVVNHPQVKDFDLSSVSKITYGASPIPERTLLTAMKVLPNARFCQIFGQTESGPAVTALPPKYHVTEGAYAGKLKSVGFPMIGVDLSIQDESGVELPRNEIGEICVRNPSVSPGYWNLPELTAESRRGDWLRTGDAGYLDDDGLLYIADRIKDMIISGGENVYPAEVEAALLRHDSVAECVVIGIPSEKWGEQVHALVRLTEGSPPSEEALIAHCREQIAGYKCIRSVEFRDEPFPLSAANKILKRELRAPYWREHQRRI
ncbi:MAG: long-chain fatty acid--CoA ligase [Pseudomonadales bacterium]